jgi:glyoxylase-like metal-dependent hydrolase (beta-lactamase superfamily II)
LPTEPAAGAVVDDFRLAGLSRVALPIGVDAVESVDMHVLADGDSVTLVDCGVWRPDPPDGGLAAVEAGLESAGYALRDVARIVVTHAHTDHYGVAGRFMEFAGTELTMHSLTAHLTDLDCEKYRHPDTARGDAGTPMPITGSGRWSARISELLAGG